MEELIRMTEDRDKRRKYVHGVLSPQIEENRTEHFLPNIIKTSQNFTKLLQNHGATSYQDTVYIDKTFSDQVKTIMFTLASNI